MLQHEVLIVLDGEAVLLVGVGGVLLQLELKLVNEHLGLFLVGFWRGGGLEPLLDNALEELLGLELDNRLDPKQRFANIGRLIIRAVRQHIPIRDSITKKIVVSPLSEVTNMNSGTEV